MAPDHDAARGMRWGWLLVGLVVVAALGGLSTLRVWPPLATVMSASMEPTIDTGDVVVLKRLDDAPQVGDIVAISVPDDARARYGYPPVVIHRVVRVSAKGEVTTKGDARKENDPFSVPRSAVTTKVVATVPAAGQIVAFLKSGLGLLWLLGGAAVLFGMPLLDRHRAARDQEEHAAADVGAQLRAISEELAQLRAERRGEPLPRGPTPAPAPEPALRANPFPPPAPTAAPAVEAAPTFAAYADAWLQRRIDGAAGARPIADRTAADHRARIANHLTPFFGGHRLDVIDADLCLAFSAHKRDEADELRRQIAAGGAPGDGRGRRARPLSPATIRKLTDCLGAILDQAVQDGILATNPARTGARHLGTVAPAAPTRLFLEMSELAMLADAAAEQDAPHGAARPAAYAGRRAMVALLGGSSLRAGELCDLRIADVRLHAAAGAHVRAGAREVPIGPGLVEELVTHIDRLRRAGLSTAEDAFVFPNARGARLRQQRVGEILRHAGALTSTRLASQGRPPLPATTPATLRATYLSVALLAERLDPARIPGAGAAGDAALIAGIAEQLRERLDGGAPDASELLRRDARERLYGATHGAGAGTDALIDRWRAAPPAGR